jgi:hypothetical protein
MLRSMKDFFRQPNLICFSPPVMIATIFIELGLATWVFARYAVGSSRRLIIAMLICLAAFQLAEFNVCSPALPDIVWSRIGYVFITLLPAFGLHLVTRLRRENRPTLTTSGYAIAGLFAVAFAALPTALNRGICTGNYVIFLLAQPLSTLYGYYYLGLVLLGLALALWPLRHASATQRIALHWTAFGYLAFSVPTLIINFLLPLTRLGIPSIMCGFAVILAIILGLRVAPLAKDTHIRRA